MTPTSDPVFLAVFEQALDGIFIADAEGRYLAVNPGGHRLLGYGPEELVGRRIADVVRPADLPRLESHLSRVHSGEAPLELWPLLRKDGSIVEVELLAQRMADGRLLAIARHAGDQAMARAELRASEERLRATLESTPDVAVQWYDARGRVLLWNRASEKMFGFSSAEAVGKTLDALIHTPEEFKVFLDTLVQVRTSGKPTPPTEYEFRRRDGSTGTCLSTIFEIPGPRGEPQFVCMDVDLTERKRLEQQFLHAQRLEGVGRLAGGVAHDFNNLLTTILGFGGLARRAVEEASPAARYLDQVLEAGRKGSALTRQLLSFSRRQPIRQEATYLDPAVERLCPFLKSLVGEDVRLNVETGAPGSVVRLDLLGLEQALLNLAVNARDAMPGGGTLTIRTSASETSAFIHVQDTGEGMVPEVRARLFEPFFTTKPPGRGTGLGLAMVQAFLSRNNGSIDVRTEPGRGSEFRIALPLHPETPAPLPPPVLDPQLPRGTERILLVEDQEAVRSFASELLASCGYAVTSAAGGEEALRIASDRPFDLLLTDVVMPGMSGRALAEQLTSRFPGLKVLYTSGFTGDDPHFTDLESRGFPFLPKPYTPQTLARKVRELLGP